MKKGILLIGFCCWNLILFGQEAKLMLPIGHTGRVFSAQFSPNGKMALTISRDRSAKLWEVESGKLLMNFLGNISCGQFSQDGKKIVFGNFDGSIQIIKVKTGKNITSINGQNHDVSSVVFSKNGNRLLTTSFGDSVVNLLDVRSGKLISKFSANRDIAFAEFSPDNEKIIACFERSSSNADSDLVKVWETKTGKLLYNIFDTTKWVNQAVFSPDNKLIFTSANYISKILDAETGRPIKIIREHSQFGFHGESFSPDSKKIALLMGRKDNLPDDFNVGDSVLKIYSTLNGKALYEIKVENNLILSAKFSPNGENLVVAFDNGFLKFYNAENGIPINPLKIQFSDPFNNPSADETVLEFSKDDKNLLTNSSNNSLKVWNINTGNLNTNLNGGEINLGPKIKFSADSKNVYNKFRSSLIHPTKIWNISNGKQIGIVNGNDFSANGKLIAGIENEVDSVVKIWNVPSGKLSVILSGSKSEPNDFWFPNPFPSQFFTPDNKQYLTLTNKGSIIKIWDAVTGKLNTDLKASNNRVGSFRFSKDSRKLVVGYLDSTAKIWNIETGKLLVDIKMQSPNIYAVDLSSDGTKILATDKNGIKLFDAITGKLQNEIKLKQVTPTIPILAVFSPNGKRIISTPPLGIYKIWDTESGSLIADLDGKGLNFSPDGKEIITGSNGTIKLWDLETGNLVTTFKGKNDDIYDVSYSPDLKNMITTHYDGANDVWDALSHKKLYTYYSVDSTDYLVTDPYGRYDGSEGARKLLYFTCGTEVIGLDQVKDQLWVPNLAERIMKGDSINAKKLSDLDICGLIPQVEKEEKTGYHFMITPQRGGLGETVLFVNDIEVKRFKPTQLTKTPTGYELNLTDQELQPYFIAGQENPVTVKAYTANNDISSRGAKIIQDETKKQAIAPNLYAVMIGVSDYKGAELQLKYAAKDATDISDAVKLSAGKLLGKEHVFTYNLTTSANHYQLPEKLAIKNVLAEIGKKANANDILLIFFAGHGVISGEKKQFYFLTADASQASATDAPEQVGISTTELSDWMKPANIKAQKRILILDACNSGQAINELVKVGNSDQNYLAARNDDKAEQIKAIDKLNEKSGLFILAASASNQSAYEMGRYSQGLLTYSLLKAIKQQPDILEDNKYLNVSRWFNAAEKTVSDMVRETGNRQEPQIVSAGNFNIGLVDQDVMAGIKLAEEKPLFTASNFQNSALDDDNLEISSLINQNMYEISARSTDSQISYVTASNSPDAWSLSGRYEVQGDDIIIKINIKQNKEIKHKLEIKGKKAELKTLAENVVKQASNWILKIK